MYILLSLYEARKIHNFLVNSLIANGKKAIKNIKSDNYVQVYFSTLMSKYAKFKYSSNNRIFKTNSSNYILNCSVDNTYYQRNNQSSSAFMFPILYIIKSDVVYYC